MTGKMVEFSLFTLDMAHELVLIQNTLVLSTHTYPNNYGV